MNDCVEEHIVRAGASVNERSSTVVKSLSGVEDDLHHIVSG